MNLITIVITLLILSVLVVVHELGHFLTAKKTGVFVEEFAIGMGPKLYKHQGKETLFTIRAFPIGGFCKMRGEEPTLDDEGNFLPADPTILLDSRSFEGKSKAQRLLILVAGSGMNILFAFLCLVIVGLLTGKLNFFQALGYGAVGTFNFGTVILDSFKMLVTGQVGLKDLAGPIGMVSMVDTFINQGFIVVLAFSAMLSVNLGIVNLLPIPALDGGRIFVIFVEMIMRRKFKLETEMKINFVGFMLLISLMVLIAVNDIIRLIP